MCVCVFVCIGCLKTGEWNTRYHVLCSTSQKSYGTSQVWVIAWGNVLCSVFFSSSDLLRAQQQSTTDERYASTHRSVTYRAMRTMWGIFGTVCTLSVSGQSLQSVITTHCHPQIRIVYSGVHSSANALDFLAVSASKMSFQISTHLTHTHSSTKYTHTRDGGQRQRRQRKLHGSDKQENTNRFDWMSVCVF